MEIVFFEYYLTQVDKYEVIYGMFHILNCGFEIETNILYSSENANNKSHE